MFHTISSSSKLSTYGTLYVHALHVYVLQENIRSLVKYTVEKFMTSLESLDYTQTFQELKVKHEQNKYEKENKKR